MASTDLLIDGYNLLHAAGLGRSHYGPGDLQRARQSLLRRLFELLTHEEIVRTAVVFDARQPPPHLPPHWFIQGLRVVYARPHGDADLLLEELINGHSHPKRLTVVSSDHRLHRAAKSRRAVAVDSEEFLAFLEHRRRPTGEVRLPIPAKAKPTADVAATELAYWMSIFGDVRVTDLQDPTRRVSPPQKAVSPPPATPAQEAKQPGKPSKSHTKKGAAPRRPITTEQAVGNSPELFSAEWIDELQRWVDEQQV